MTCFQYQLICCLMVRDSLSIVCFGSPNVRVFEHRDYEDMKYMKIFKSWPSKSRACADSLQSNIHCIIIQLPPAIGIWQTVIRMYYHLQSEVIRISMFLNHRRLDSNSSKQAPFDRNRFRDIFELMIYPQPIARTLLFSCNNYKPQTSGEDVRICPLVVLENRVTVAWANREAWRCMLNQHGDLFSDRKVMLFGF